MALPTNVETGLGPQRREPDARVRAGAVRSLALLEERILRRLLLTEARAPEFAI